MLDSMWCYRLAEQNLCFSHRLIDVAVWEIKNTVMDQAGLLACDLILQNASLDPLCRTTGWVGDANRTVEVYQISQGMLLRIEDSDDFIVTPRGDAIYKYNSKKDLTRLEHDVILGPALVLALGLCGVWSLHASAATLRKKVIVFLGESGQGKSTLAGYLSKASGWGLVADDILPAKMAVNGVSLLPHFPQLKLPVATQPGLKLPESLPLDKVCVLKSTTQEAAPELELLSPGLAVQALLRHTAGTRIFSPEMLGKHLSFCSQAATRVPVYQLSYPHRRDALPQVKELLESIC
jgi:hypothetical protein